MQRIGREWLWRLHTLEACSGRQNLSNLLRAIGGRARCGTDEKNFPTASEQIAPDTTEPRYDQEYRIFLARYFRDDTPVRERTSLTSVPEWFGSFFHSIAIPH
jgi:hypothetical protein